MRKLLLLLILAGLGYAGWRYRAEVPGLLERAGEMVDRWRGEAEVPADPKPDRARYEVMRDDLERWRGRLAAVHGKARTAEAREAAERDARVLLESVLPELMRCWLGTPWAFEGTADGPGGDPVACGYFVSTVLRDAGFQLDRYRLAQQPSSRILTTFVPEGRCRLLVDVPYDEFSRKLVAMEAGIYLVGLDTHVAFLVVGRDGFRFIHSSGAEPRRVVEETAGEATVLRNSRWRMLANLTADPGAMRRWLEGKPFVVGGRG